MSKEEQMNHMDRQLDLSNACLGLWLVKVPKYLASRLDGNGGKELGKMRISRTPGQKAQLTLTIDDAIEKMNPNEPIPKRHCIEVSAVNRKTMGVFSYQPSK